MRESGSQKLKDVDLELIYRALDFDVVPEESKQPENDEPEVIVSEETVEDFDEPEIKIDTATGVSVFNFESNNIRTVVDDGEVWFAAKDVAKSLGYVDTKGAVIRHVHEGDYQTIPLQTAGGLQNIKIINESGMYALVFGSELETSKRFKKWVTSEVLPTIRKTGKYEIPKEEPNHFDLKAAIDIVNETKSLAQAIGMSLSNTNAFVCDTLKQRAGIDAR